MRKRTYIIGIISVALISIGATFRILHMPGASVLAIVGVIIFTGFAVLFTIDKVSLEKKRSAKVSHIVLAVAMVLVFISVLLNVMHIPGNRELGSISIVVFVVYLVFFTRHTEGRKLKMQKDRQLASILFTDIVGFTGMMGEDEDRTLLALERNRTIQKGLIRRYRGEWVKEMGDGSIAIFYTASEAVQCALEIQKEIKTNEEFKVRMGIHISEILFSDKDIFGDGVNVASRICSLADANEICISGIVYQNIKNREALKILEMGSQELKNVNYSVETYKLVG